MNEMQEQKRSSGIEREQSAVIESEVIPIYQVRYKKAGQRHGASFCFEDERST